MRRRRRRWRIHGSVVLHQLEGRVPEPTDGPLGERNWEVLFEVDGISMVSQVVKGS
jgi:hypothetical protein